ncbi:hypothetical protein [Cystobacter fuscus]|uniref:SitA5 family polymorphic toxin n=1 Tax=Cystobacter fuscus TaxID=43 RepID=UPI002B2FE200|nr:hypothetical protein F0U63_47350 [Cystobacter fuscus]
MLDKWRGLMLLLVVPWLTNCVTRPGIRLDTGQGPSIVYTPPTSEPPPVELHQEEFVEALTNLVLNIPLTLSPPRWERQVALASWEGSRNTTPPMPTSQYARLEIPGDRLLPPKNAPPPETLARMRLALSFSMDTVWEGAAVPISEVVDPLAFKLMVYTAMCTYLLSLMIPEPVTKGLSAVLTVILVAYLGLGPVWSMVKAGWQMLHDCEQATTTGELKQAGHRFGRVLGDNGMRVLLLLATAAIGGEASFKGMGPRLPGFGQAALASPIRTGVILAEVGQVKTVVIGAKELVVGLAPTAVATAALGTGSEAPTNNKKGSLTGRPSQPGPEADEATHRGIKRENESARVLAENGYHVEQNPIPKPNGKEPDYKINGEYADCISPSTSNARNIASRIKAEKINREQADRIVLNLEDSGVTIEAMRKQLQDWPISGLKQLIVIKDGKVVMLFP